MMIAKKHITPDKRLILAVCDSDLLGKRLTDDDIELDMNSDFYKGTKTADEDVRKYMKAAYSINVVGQKSVQTAIDLGLVETVLQVQGVPYAQVLYITE